MKHLVYAGVIGLTLASSAWAQTTTQPSTTPATPPATAPSTPSAVPATPQGTMAAGPQWHQRMEGEMRASKLIGTTVRNAANENIGDVNDVLIDPSGKVTAVVLGVGGFLGIGERLVAVNFSDVKMTQDGNTVALTVNATKESLSSAPQWSWTSDTTGRTTTGTGTTGTGTTAPAGTKR